MKRCESWSDKLSAGTPEALNDRWQSPEARARGIVPTGAGDTVWALLSRKTRSWNWAAHKAQDLEGIPAKRNRGRNAQPCLEKYKTSPGDWAVSERKEIPSLHHGRGVQIYTPHVVLASPYMEITGKMHPKWRICGSSQKKQFLKCSEARRLQPRKHTATIQKLF